MRTFSLLVVFAACLSLAATDVLAQRGGGRERGGRGGPGIGGPPGGPGGRRDMMRMLPLMKALDADEDGEISTKEIDYAVAALKTLDKNKDGKLTAEELRPDFGRGERRFGRSGGIGNRVDADAGTKRLMERDKNKDGKLAHDEVPERLHRMFDRADSDEDGFLSKEEVSKMLGHRGRGRGGRGGRDGADRPRRAQRRE